MVWKPLPVKKENLKQYTCASFFEPTVLGGGGLELACAHGIFQSEDFGSRKTVCDFIKITGLFEPLEIPTQQSCAHCNPAALGLQLIII
jgi:hypothetical protein